MNWDSSNSWDPRIKKWLPLVRVFDRIAKEVPESYIGRPIILPWVGWDFLFKFRFGRMANEILQGQDSLDEIKTASFLETVGVLLIHLVLMTDMVFLALIRRVFAKLPGGR